MNKPPVFDTARIDAEREEREDFLGFLLAFLRSVVMAIGFFLAGTTLLYAVGVTMTDFHGGLYLLGTLYGLWISRRLAPGRNLSVLQIAGAGLLHLMVLGVGVTLAMRISDISEEGMAAEAESVILLARGWNPLLDENFVIVHDNAWIAPTDPRKVPLYSSEGHQAASGHFVSALILRLTGSIDASKGYRFLLAMVLLVGTAAFFIRCGVPAWSGTLAGVSVLAFSCFTVSWTTLQPAYDGVFFLPLLAGGILAAGASGKTGWPGGARAGAVALFLTAFTGSAGMFLSVTALFLISVLLLRSGWRPERIFRELLPLWVAVGAGLLLAWRYGIAPPSPGGEGPGWLATLFGAAARSGEAAIADPIPDTGALGPFFAPALVLGVLLSFRSMAMFSRPDRGILPVVFWLLLGLAMFPQGGALAAQPLAFLPALLMLDALRRIPEPSLQERWTRGRGLIFVNLAPHGYTARMLAVLALVGTALAGSLLGWQHYRERSLAESEMREFLFRPRWVVGDNLVTRGPEVIVYRWFEERGAPFTLFLGDLPNAENFPMTSIEIVDAGEDLVRLLNQ